MKKGRKEKAFDPTDLSIERWNKSSIEDKKRINWHKDWNNLKDIEREFLLLIFSDILDRDKIKIKSIHKCINAAFEKMIKEGFIKEQSCSRCNGSGHYSFNLQDGSMCWGCQGTGIERPKITKKLIINIKKLGFDSAK